MMNYANVTPATINAIHTIYNKVKDINEPFYARDLNLSKSEFMSLKEGNLIKETGNTRPEKYTFSPEEGVTVTKEIDIKEWKLNQTPIRRMNEVIGYCKSLTPLLNIISKIAQLPLDDRWEWNWRNKDHSEEINAFIEAVID